MVGTFGQRVEQAPPKRPRVLIVDDNEVNRAVSAAVCDAAGFQYEFATNGFEAVDAVARCTFDLVLMDIYMPGMDGLAAAEAIRKLPRAAALPIIAVTSDASPSARTRYEAAGLIDVVAKPLTPGRLLGAMAGALSDALETRRGRDPASSSLAS